MRKLLRHDPSAVAAGALALVILIIPFVTHPRLTESPAAAVVAPLATPTATAILGAIETLSGNATWYDWRPGQAAAGPGLRAALGVHWRGQSVTVCTQNCVRVKLTDWCLCSHGNRLIDLDDASFAKLAPLSAGVIAVTIKIGQSQRAEPEAAPTAPATDIGG